MNKPKKIRLLSYQNAHNYGAVLQAYGLQSVLKEHGYDDVKFINYNPCYLSSRYIPIPLKKIFFQVGMALGLLYGNCLIIHFSI